jgi:AraC-like DNA-binding protein
MLELRAASILRQEYRSAWTAESLASCLAVGSRTLARRFYQQFGCSMFEYQRVARSVAALEQLRTNNVEAVALDVGYGSKANLYHTLVAVVGMTPSDFRALSPDAARLVIERIRRKLLRPPTCLESSHRSSTRRATSSDTCRR